MIHLKPKTKYFFFIALSFVLCTIVGTLSHEMGHWTMAKMLGYDAEINYSSARYDNDKQLDNLYYLYSQKTEAENKAMPFQQKDEYEKLKAEVDRKSFYFTLGGPIQTILFGTVGFIWLIYRRKKRAEQPLNLTDYAAIFLALFWLREVFNPVFSVAQSLWLSGSIYFGGDELKLARYLDLPDGGVAIPLAIIGAAICYYVIYHILPKDKRSTFIDAGLFGGIAGYFLWMRVLGPVLMP